MKLLNNFVSSAVGAAAAAVTAAAAAAAVAAVAAVATVATVGAVGAATSAAIRKRSGEIKMIYCGGTKGSPKTGEFMNFEPQRINI